MFSQIVDVTEKVKKAIYHQQEPGYAGCDQPEH